MKKVKTMDCGYCPYEFCPVMESDGSVKCPYVVYELEESDIDTSDPCFGCESCELKHPELLQEDPE